MIERQSTRATAILVIHLAFITGIVVFEWSPLAVIAVFVADAFLGITRILLERSFAGRPPGNTVPADDPYNSFETFYEYLLDKRGSIKVSYLIPAIYPRNLPFVFSRHVIFVPLGVVAILTAIYVQPPVGGLDMSLIVIFLVIVGKHLLILASWHTLGLYEQASVTTVRPREIMYTALIGAVAITILYPQPAVSGRFITAAVVALVLKLVFDFREIGVGPDQLIFDPRANTAEKLVEAPDGNFDRVFETNNRAVYREGAVFGLFYSIYPGLFITGLWGLAIVIQFDSITINLVTLLFWVGFTVAGISLLAVWWMWIGCANVEYRVFEDDLVAYDTYLGEPQWTLSDEIVSVSENERVIIQCQHRDDRQVEFLERPDEFVHFVRRVLID